MGALVIYFTGLLLFAPDAATGRMHVLAPEVGGGIARHVTQIGFAGPKIKLCAAYELHDTVKPGICYVNMDEWALELFTTEASAQMPSPQGAINLSDRYSTRMSRKRLSKHPDGSVRSRVTMGRGSVTNPCALAEWAFGTEDMWLTNVVEWTIPNVRPEDLRLVMTRLDHDSWEVWEPSTRELPISTAGGNVFLIVRHVPRERMTESPDERLEASHFREFYRLIGITPPGHLPRRGPEHEEIEPPCRMPRGEQLFGDRFSEVITSATTYSCMVASGLPAPTSLGPEQQ